MRKKVERNESDWKIVTIMALFILAFALVIWAISQPMTIKGEFNAHGNVEFNMSPSIDLSITDIEGKFEINAPAYMLMHLLPGR